MENNFAICDDKKIREMAEIVRSFDVITVKDKDEAEFIMEIDELLDSNVSILEDQYYKLMKIHDDYFNLADKKETEVVLHKSSDGVFCEIIGMASNKIEEILFDKDKNISNEEYFVKVKISCQGVEAVENLKVNSRLYNLIRKEIK